MRSFMSGCFLLVLWWSCNKEGDGKCNIEKEYRANSKKVTITTGVWGTVSLVEGNCMPTIPPCRTCCTDCPVPRTIQIYQYTNFIDAVTTDPYKVFYDSFNTPLVMQVDADDNGFFQAEIPPGKYSLVVIENGKLYPPSSDGQGGLNPILVANGRLNFNVIMTYKATY